MKKEIRSRKIQMTKSGGNSGKNGTCCKLSLPNVWLKEMGISRDNREVEIIFDGKEIRIRKKK